MKQIQKGVVSALVLGLSLSWGTPASAEVDPFPGLAYGSEVGQHQLVSSSTGMPVDGSSIITCPTGAGLSSVANATTHENYVVCTKTWRPLADIEADAAFEQARRDGEAAAEAQSLAWNQAHPGQQKCFQWGPILHANGVSTATGGVCANPVPVPTGYIAETSTAVETVTALTPSESATNVSAQQVINQSNRFGGYAVVHPDGHVCGVVVSASSDPFENGGYMSQEYMGCPSGSRFVFQTTPSETGNVAGWHGLNVTWDGSQFTIAYPNSWIHIANGIATDNTGKVWDTGTGRVISAGTAVPPVVSDTATVKIDTPTVTSETTTPVVPVAVDSPTVVTPVAVAFNLPVAVSATDTQTAVAPVAADDLDSLPEVIAEEEISNSVIATVIGTRTRIAVASAWANTRLSVVAWKKGSKKKYTYRFTTNSEGDYIFRSGANLTGYLVVLYKGSEELDRDYV